MRADWRCATNLHIRSHTLIAAANGIGMPSPLGCLKGGSRSDVNSGGRPFPTPSAVSGLRPEQGYCCVLASAVAAAPVFEVPARAGGSLSLLKAAAGKRNLIQSEP